MCTTPAGCRVAHRSANPTMSLTNTATLSKCSGSTLRPALSASATCLGKHSSSSARSRTPTDDVAGATAPGDNGAAVGSRGQRTSAA